MKLIYSGVSHEVEIPHVGIVATRDVPTDVPDSIAKGLLEQDSWSKAPTSKEGK